MSPNLRAFFESNILMIIFILLFLNFSLFFFKTLRKIRKFQLIYETRMQENLYPIIQIKF